jgi:formylglycine-generating enzyme required for sulfatase activity
MGSADGDAFADGNEKPRRTVTICKPFYLGKYEVTQARWEEAMGNNPSEFEGKPKHPVGRVSWDGVQEFIQRLNLGEGHDRYRLPTGAEWEYAARAGSTGAFSFGDDAGQPERYAWNDESWNSGSTHPMGQKQPNAWCLHDMRGNVVEWVRDRYGQYPSGPVSDPSGPSTGADPDRVFRGGCWADFWGTAAPPSDAPTRRTAGTEVLVSG